MVPYLGGIVEDALLGRVFGRVLDHVFERGAGQRRAFHQLVEIGDVGLVVLAVVERQRIGRDVGRERVLRRRAGGEGVKVMAASLVEVFTGDAGESAAKALVANLRLAAVTETAATLLQNWRRVVSIKTLLIWLECMYSPER